MLVRCQPSLLTTLCVCQQSVQLHAGEMPAISAECSSTTANVRRRQLFLFLAVSRVLYGYEEAHMALRLMCAIQVGLNDSSYDGTSPQRHQLLRQGLVVCPEYLKVFRELATDSSESCFVAIIAASSVLGFTVESY